MDIRCKDFIPRKLVNRKFRSSIYQRDIDVLADLNKFAKNVEVINIESFKTYDDMPGFRLWYRSENT